MVSIINLEDLPQLVLEKIISLLNHKQLSSLEQVSRKLKHAVHCHFSTTDHLIIGSLPEVTDSIDYDEATAKEKKCLDGLLTLIKRCGIRLRTIQITNIFSFPVYHIQNYRTYFKHFFASADFSINSPNVENIIASPYMDIFSIHSHEYGYAFVQQKVLLNEDVAEVYAKNIKLSTGKRCKLRSIGLSYMKESLQEESYERILNLYSNIEQMHVINLSENFYKLLPQFMKNGLKDLNIGCTFSIDYRIAKKCCNIWNDLRTLRLVLPVHNDDDIAALNKLQLPKNVELKIVIRNVDDCLAQLNENVCNSVIECTVFGLTGYSLTKLKRLQGFDIENSEILQLIAQGLFINLKRLRIHHDVCNCKYGVANTCDSQIFLPQLLLNKGNQLNIIHIRYVCHKSMHMVWRALKHCNAAKYVQIERVDVDSLLTVSYEDVETIYTLPNLQHFVFWIIEIAEHDACGLLRQFNERAVKTHKDFYFEYDLTLNYVGFLAKYQYLSHRIDS